MSKSYAILAAGFALAVGVSTASIAGENQSSTITHRSAAWGSLAAPASSSFEDVGVQQRGARGSYSANPTARFNQEPAGY